MTCFYCKGTMKEGFTTHVVELKSCIVIVKHVPCMKCDQCGETVFSSDALKQLDKITDTLETSLTEVAIVNYPGKVA